MNHICHSGGNIISLKTLRYLKNKYEIIIKLFKEKLIAYLIIIYKTNVTIGHQEQKLVHFPPQNTKFQSCYKPVFQVARTHLIYTCCPGIINGPISFSKVSMNYTVLLMLVQLCRGTCTS